MNSYTRILIFSLTMSFLLTACQTYKPPLPDGNNRIPVKNENIITVDDYEKVTVF